MTYKVAKKQPKLRDPELKYDEVGPGLYNDGEVLVEVDGITCTVSFETTWQTNSSGVHILGTARWCDAEGVTKLTALQQHVETQTSISINPVQIEKHGVEAFVKEALLVLLGQPPELMDKVDVEGEDKPREYLAVQLSHEMRLNGSIVHAVHTVTSTEGVKSVEDILKGK